MGKLLSSLGGKKRTQQLNKWKESVWEFKVGKAEINNLLEARKRKLEAQISEEISKRKKLKVLFQSLKLRLMNKFLYEKKSKVLSQSLKHRLVKKFQCEKKLRVLFQSLLRNKTNLRMK